MTCQSPNNLSVLGGKENTSAKRRRQNKNKPTSIASVPYSILTAYLLTQDPSSHTETFSTGYRVAPTCKTKGPLLIQYFDYMSSSQIFANIFVFPKVEVFLKIKCQTGANARGSFKKCVVLTKM